jgi:hypothetical protein
MIITTILLFWLLSFVIGAIILTNVFDEAVTPESAAILICFLLFSFNTTYTVMVVEYTKALKKVNEQLIEERKPNKLPEKELDNGQV